MTAVQNLGRSALQAGKTIIVNEVQKGAQQYSLSFIRLLVHLALKGSITVVICLILLLQLGMLSLPWQLKALLGLGGGFFPQSTLVSPDSDPEITQVMEAIIGQESGGNCSAVNPDSGALGYGQVMPENLGPDYNWGTQTVGYNVTPQQFLADCDLQVQIIAGKLQNYYDEGLTASGGDADEAIRYVAAKWYSGDGSLKDSYRPEIWAETGTEYPSIGEYSNQVLDRVRSGSNGVSYEEIQQTKTAKVQNPQPRGSGAITITIQWPQLQEP